jgi:chromate transporter
MPPALAESLPRIFLAFARVGLLGFGGPAAQIALAHSVFVGQRQWVTPQRFTRALAVYQALPGPEALEMCCWLGAVRRGPAGALAAGLGFALPGTLLVLLAAILYTHAIDPSTRQLPASISAALALAQGVVTVLVLKAGLDLARRCLAPQAPAPTAPTSPLGPTRFAGFRTPVLWLALIASVATWFALQPSTTPTPPPTTQSSAQPTRIGPLHALRIGLEAGSLSFGGAYSALPILQLRTSASVSQPQFLNALAIVTILPAPLVSLAAFLGTLAGGPVVGIIMFAGIIAPALAITLVGHNLLERLVNWPAAHALLDVLGALAIGLVLATGLVLARELLSAPGTPRAPQIAALAALLVLALVHTAAPRPWRKRWGGYLPALLVLLALATGAALGA